MGEANPVDIVLAIYDAFRLGDVAAILDRIHEQGELRFEGPSAIPWVGTWSSREGWGKFFQTLGHTLDQVTVAMEVFAAQEDKVVAVGRYHAIVKRTGKRIDSPLVHLWTIKNGTVLRCVELTNTAAEAAACASDPVAV
jgi:ketosteroid isomerase-like protein